jgi:Flp pilus assembly protein TadG
MTRRSVRSERGAALVEMAVVLPLFVVLLFGIIETGWLFSQQVEIRHSAREAARVAAVSTPDINGGGFSADDIRERACATMALSGDSVTEIKVTSAGTDIGDNATVTVTVVYDALTGLLDPIFDGLSIDTSVEFRLEQPRLWTDTTFATSPICP